MPNILARTPSTAARQLFSALIAAVTALIPTISLGPAIASAAPAATACGTPLAPAETAAIAELSDTGTLTGSALRQLEEAVDRHRRITEILVAHRDPRGVFALGLDAVERAAVLPLRSATPRRSTTRSGRIGSVSNCCRASCAQCTPNSPAHPSTRTGPTISP
jgi:hypothetical protein